MTKIILYLFLSIGIIITCKVNAQHSIDIAEVIESMHQIALDAKDTIAKYNEIKSRFASWKIKNAQILDSTINLIIKENKSNEIHKDLSRSMDVFYPNKLTKLKNKMFKSWLGFQISSRLLGGQVGYILDNKEYLEEFLFTGIEREQDFKYSPKFLRSFEELKEKKGTQELVLLGSFPSNGQLNFSYAHGMGGIFIFNRIDAILKNKPNDRLIARWSTSSGLYIFTLAKIDTLHKLVLFEIPTYELKQGTIYKLDLIRVGVSDEVYKFWSYRISLNQPFYDYPLKSFIYSICDVSDPITTIYFRTSAYSKIIDKFKDMLFVIDTIDYSMKLGPLKEPFDSTELISNKVQNALLEFKPSPIINPTYDVLLQSSVYNYLMIPETPNSKVDDFNVLNEFEKAGLLNQPNIYKIEENAKWTWPPVKLDSSISLSNGYFFDFTAPPKTIYCVNGKIPRNVNEETFKSGKITIDTQYLEIKSDFWQMQEKQYNEVKDALKKRVKQRANFFYIMELRDCKRTGRLNNTSLQDYLNKELKNIPKSVSDIFNKEFSVHGLYLRNGYYKAIYNYDHINWKYSLTIGKTP